ncbi:MAG TPA: hypothetical protein VJU59_20390 [Paraburkholderia sp.]|uniref:hypothetical protein n=1 Tax=Paraburkholderia sp. TaxID=1926495 RepID=UPI002B4AA047|nr:hypothetical protein [Paraburkholderia sp.]HKR41997.1 hypothetical protein [Paraburkholderia sp.]
MLLPLPERTARNLSLVNHLIFVVCKKNSGNAYHLREMIRLVYLTFYLQEAGYGNIDLLDYARAEAALERCLTRAESEDAWQLDPNDNSLFEMILRQSDRQIKMAPCHRIVEARERLARFARSSRDSPLPKPATNI